MEPNVISQLDFEAQRRRKLAEALSKGNDKQIASPLEGLAKVLREGVAGYQSGKASKLENESKQRQADIIAGVVSGKTPREEGMAQLAQVPAYQDVALKAAIEKPKFEGLKESAEQALLAQAMGQPLSPEQEASLQAFDKLRQTERMYDPRQNVVPKFSSLIQSPEAARAASIPAQGTPLPASGENMPAANGVLLPPSTGGEQDKSMFTVPEGLDAKARGQFMDAMAATAAERAANGGMPKMTAEQSQANVRGTILGSSLQGLEKLMFDPEIDAGRMAGAKTLGDIVPDAAGPFVANSLMNPKEQLFDSSMAGAKESLAGAMTGAAFTEQQAKNFTAMLPNGTEAPQIRREKLLNAYRYAIAVTEGAGAAGLDSRRQFEEALNRLQQETAPVAPAGGQEAGPVSPTSPRIDPNSIEQELRRRGLI